MKETIFEPAIWHNSLQNLQKAIGYVEHNEGEELLEDVLVGLLTFKDGLSLVLDIPYGTIVHKKYIELENGGRAYAGEYEDIDNVFGYSRNGKWYVLKDIYVRNWTESHPGFSAQTIEGNSLIVSNKPVSYNPLVDCIKLDLDGFTKWFRNFNITRKYEMNKDEDGNYTGCKKISHEYEPPKSFILYQNDDMKISVEQSGIEAGGPVINPEASLSVASNMVISYTKPIELENAIQTIVHQLRELISILSGVFCSIETVEGYSINKKINIQFYAPFIRREHKVNNDEVMHMPFPFPKIEGEIAEIIDKWLNLDLDAVNAATIIVSRLDGSIMPCDLGFISCASAFEALSRVGVAQEHFEQKKFDAYMSKISDFIEDGDFKEWLMRQIHNRRSAGSLARALLKRLRPFSSYLLPDKEKFLNDHRICRNAYVHRSALESSAVLKDEKLYIHTKAVWFLCYVAILDLIGIKPEESLEALKESSYQNGVISQIRKQYAK